MTAIEFISAMASGAGDMFQAAQNTIVNAVKEYGPQAVDAVLWVVRLDNLQTLLAAWIPILILAFVARQFYKSAGKDAVSKAAMDKDVSAQREASAHPLAYGSLLVESESLEKKVFIKYVAATVFALSTCFYIPQVTNLWLYVGVAKPELFLTKKVVDVVVNKVSAPSQPEKK